MGNELNGAKGDKGERGGGRGGDGRRIQGEPGAREQVKAHGPGIARIGESIIPRLISHAGILFPPLRASEPHALSLALGLSRSLCSPSLAGESCVPFFSRGFLSCRIRYVKTLVVHCEPSTLTMPAHF